MKWTLFMVAGGLLPAAAFAHLDHAYAPGEQALAWNWNPLTLILLALSGILYFSGLRRLRRRAGPQAGIRRREAASFWAGWLTLAAALVSPLDPLGEMLFSAHMVQHELLMIVAAPLLVLGRPLAVFVWALPLTWRRHAGGAAKWRPLRALWRAVTRPFGAWTIHALVLWIWHVPSFFQAGVESVVVHTFQHLSFLIAALLFWWSLFDERHSRGIAVIYLLTTAIHTGLLGAMLTFSGRLWYPVYASRTGAWGLTPLEDQQLGGLIMWVPGGLPYLIAGLWLASRLLLPADVRSRGTGEAS